MQKILLHFMLLAATIHGAAQSTTGNVAFNTWGNQVNIYNGEGKLIETSYAGIEGSPFYKPGCTPADILLSGGRKLLAVPANIDLHTQEARIITANNMEALLNKGVVKEIVFADTLEGLVRKRIFKTGYPSIDRQDMGDFYESLTEGRCTLLCHTSTRMLSRKIDFSVQYVNYFSTTELLYLFMNNQLVPVKKGKDFILTQLQDKKQVLTQFITANNLDCKNRQDLITVINYYNSL